MQCKANLNQFKHIYLFFFVQEGRSSAGTGSKNSQALLTHSKSDTDLIRTSTHVIIDTSDGESSHDAPSCETDTKNKVNGEVQYIFHVFFSLRMTISLWQSKLNYGYKITR